MTTSDDPTLSRLGSALAELPKRDLPPVEKWNPPDCGAMDIRIAAHGTWFHDGTPMDAAAVKFNLDRNRSDARSNIKADLVNITAVDVVGPLQVKLTLKQPDAALPAILSDRRYRPGSIVQYRFGAFRGVPVLTNDGSFEARLAAPDGSLVADPRKPWFTPPAWVPPLLPPEPQAAAPAAESAPRPRRPSRENRHRPKRWSCR